MRIRVLVGGLCALGAALALGLNGSLVNAQPPPCDFVTGGGYILFSGKDNFGAAGGCKGGSFFGHLVYKDKAIGLDVHWTSITGYQVADVPGFFPDTTARLICGTATTNLFGNVDFVVRVKDAGEPGINDEFDVRLTQSGMEKYTTFASAPHKLGGGTGGGGNTTLHKPNNSTAPANSCPALGGGNFTVTVIIDQTSSGNGTVTSTSNPPSPSQINCVADHPGGGPLTISGNCSASFAAGTTVTLTAQGNNPSFTAAAAECDSHTFGPPPTCTVTTNRSVHVRFTGGE